jgi:quercetin dioxygenase-like cupin family protein
MAQVVSTQEREFSPLSPTKKAILNQEGLRSILFCLKEGQRIPLHTSPYRGDNIGSIRKGNVLFRF